MLKTTTIRSAGNSPSDIAENAEIESGTSSTTRSAKNSPSDMVKDAELGGNSDGGDDETVKKSSLSKK